LLTVSKAASVKKAVKRGLTQRLRARVRLGDTDSDTESSEDENTFNAKQKKRKRGKFMSALRLKESSENIAAEITTIKTEGDEPILAMSEEQQDGKTLNVMVQDGGKKTGHEEGVKKEEGRKPKTHGFQLPKLASGMTSMSMLEQSMPADAVLTKEGAAEVRQTRFLRAYLTCWL
jgi:metal transporter CNNM